MPFSKEVISQAKTKSYVRNLKAHTAFPGLRVIHTVISLSGFGVCLLLGLLLLSEESAHEQATAWTLIAVSGILLLELYVVNVLFNVADAIIRIAMNSE
jgi:hypothetical protein